MEGESTSLKNWWGIPLEKTMKENSKPERKLLKNSELALKKSSG
ncbi:hypothetical protein MHK_004033 [Candidatus Magnetomorum sp. HK-1]|nr:hypothetical protein MHK_004033 [Candidatus Magnetomorum sp. HK-1]